MVGAGSCVLLFVRCLICVDGCPWFVICCMMCVVCRLSCVVRSSPFVVRSLSTCAACWCDVVRLLLACCCLRFDG